MSDWEKHNGLYIKRSPHPDSGIVDIIHNTAGKLVYDGDTSDWAFEAHLIMTDLLMKGKRWPDEYGERYDGRKQTDLTRDPFIAYGDCYIHLLRHLKMNDYSKETILTFMALFDMVHPPLRIYWYSPNFIIWWNRIGEDRRKHFTAKRLGSMMGHATYNRFMTFDDDKFFE